MINKITVPRNSPPVLHVNNGENKSKDHLLWLYSSADLSVILDKAAMCGRPKPKDGWIIEFNTAMSNRVCKTCRNIYTKDVKHNGR